ncbi:MAG: VWA domain-containing protein [Anaerolineae bacterium]|nr:VWA domain-containing protein [Anaerolineae bacterium]
MSIRPTTQSEATLLKNRLTRCLPSARFEMETLCRLAGIEISREVPTAAVECKRRPRLLINPDFVAKNCERDEHLFLLVMHELWHVLLAHTRMHPRMTPIQNIAFDAIINAGLMGQFPQPEYMGFFDAINPPDQFPHCLLRPPVGWPDEPVYPEGLPDGTKEMLMRLYPKRRTRFLSQPRLPMYEDVLALLLRHADKIPMQMMPMLLGSYEGEDSINDPLIKEMMGEVTKNWSYVPGGQRGLGGITRRNKFQPSETSEDVRRAFALVLQRTLSKRPGREERMIKHNTPVIGGNGVIPNPHGDRMIHARQALGAPETLWAQPITIRARTPDRPSRAFIYLDVSGSMNNILAQCMYLIRPYLARKQAELYQFSTVVHPMKFAEIKEGQITGTGGTDINCVFKHLLDMSPRVDRVLIFTDGMVGAPRADVVSGMELYGARLYIVLPNNGKLDPTVGQMARAVVTLPALAR